MKSQANCDSEASLDNIRCHSPEIVGPELSKPGDRLLVESGVCVLVGNGNSYTQEDNEYHVGSRSPKIQKPLPRTGKARLPRERGLDPVLRTEVSPCLFNGDVHFGAKSDGSMCIEVTLTEGSRR